MTARATQLHATADGQIAELIGLISTVDEATMRLPCRGREKLGDGTIAASARHTADNYRRMGGVPADERSDVQRARGEPEQRPPDPSVPARAWSRTRRARRARPRGR